MGEEINGITTKRTNTLYHRTNPKALEEIIKDGHFKPMNTGVLSLSSHPCHIIGGRIRLTLDAKDIDTTAICYYDTNQYGRTMSDCRKKFEKPFRDREQLPEYNLFYSHCNAYPESYRSECEHATREPVSTDNIIEIEYWITGLGTSCEAQYPPYITFDNFTGLSYDKLINEIKEARQYAEELGVPFKVNSCFKFMEASCTEFEGEEGSGYKCGVELNEENLKRIANDEKPLIRSRTAGWDAISKIKAEEGGYEEFCRC